MTTTITVSTFALQLPLLATLHAGFVRDEGLEVNYVAARGSQAQLAALLAGDLDVAHTAADNVIGRAVDAPGRIRICHVATLGNDQLAVAAPGITTWEDVRGRSVGVDAADSGYAFVLYRMLEDRGIERDAYAVAAVGGPGDRIEGLLEGDLAIGLLNPHVASRAEQAGCRVLGKAADHVPGYPNLLSAIGPSLDGPIAVAYSRALARGVRWADDPVNRDAAIGLLVRDRDCTEDVAARVYESEADLREVGCPTAEQAIASLETVATLRHEMTGVYAGPNDYLATELMAAAHAAG